MPTRVITQKKYTSCFVNYPNYLFEKLKFGLNNLVFKIERYNHRLKNTNFNKNK